MDLICYLQPSWQPLIRPAEATREWMDQSKVGYAYRCLPLNIANAHGWEILNPVGFSAVWRGGMELEDVVLDVPPGTADDLAPISMFGEAVLTFHINGLFRTPPGWNLWVGGSPNRPKDGIYPLSGVIETDWSPYTFTMNWRFTRRNHRVRFEAGEPICFIFPVQRAAVGAVRPRFLPLASAPELQGHYVSWSQSRTEFNKMLRDLKEPRPASELWQRRYFRGHDMTGQEVVTDHLSKVRAAPFEPVAPGEPFEPSLNALVALQTDTATLGTVIGEVAAAIKAGDAGSEPGRAALAQRLMRLGLGESEAIEVLAYAMDAADPDAG